MTRLIPTLALSLMTALLPACSGQKSDPDALKLFDEAKALSESPERTNNEQATLLFDSLHKAFPNELKLRKEAIYLARQLRLRMSEEDSMTFSAQYAKDSALLMQMDPLFLRDKYPGMSDDETLMRYKGYKPQDAPGKLFLDVYLRHDARIEIVAGNTGNGVSPITSLIVSDPETGDFAASDTIPTSDTGRNYSFKADGITRHRLTLSREASARIAAFIALKHREGGPVSVELQNNGKKAATFAISALQKEAITETYRFYAAYVEMKTLEEQQQRHALYRNRLRTTPNS